MKEVVLFFGKLVEGPDPIPFGEKRPTYIELCKSLIDKGAKVYTCRGYSNYLGDNSYKVQFEFDGSDFVKLEKIVKPYSVYDRAGKMFFPNILDRNVVNVWEFKVLTNNKWVAYMAFKKFFPKTFLINNIEDINQSINEFDDKKLIVIKPYNGMKGNLVEFFKKNEITKMEDFVDQNSSKTFIMQEFVDTEKGVPNIADGKHDIRVVCINNKIVWSHVRTPSAGSLKANVAEGGNINDIDINLLPQSIVDIVKEISQVFYNKFDNPIFSIDFGVENGIPYIFEFNDQIGFPRPTMKTRKMFIEELSNRLVS